MDCLDFGHLPFEIRSKLAELEVELSEGDITEKGYQKKKAKLLAPYIESTVNPSPPLTSTPNVTQSSSGLHIPCGAVQLPGLTGSALDRRRLQLRSPASSGEDGSISGPDDNSNDCENGSPLHRPQNRRYIREDGRYRSDIREEAVKEALSRNHRQRPEALLPNKRRENGRSSGAATYHDDQNDSEDDLSSEASGPGLQRLGPGPSHSSLTTPVPHPASSNYQNDITTPTSSVAAVTNHLPTHPHTNGTAENFNHMLPVTDFSSGLHLNKPRLDNNLVPMSSTSTYIPEPVGMCSADSFEQLAAQAAAQLNLVSPEFASVPQQPQYQTNSDLPPTSHGQPSMWNINATVSSSAMYSNVPPEHFTSTPHKTPVFGGVNVLPPNTTIPASLFPPTSAGHHDPSSPWLESGQPMESTFSSAMNLPSAASFQNTDAAEHSDHASSHRDSGVSQPDRSQLGLICPNRVSEKIQQLVNTLKRPKRRPLPEYFLDEEDQVLVRPVVDPSAPRPHGPPSQPLRGEELVVPSGLPRNLESALQRYAGLSCKTPVLTCLDVGGRPTQVLTYAKLLQRSIRIAYMLLNKVGHRGEQSLKPGDRVALVYANNEPISFFAAFYGCILASVVPIAIEVPSARRDASCQSMGFLLSSQNARIVLASEQCYKALQRGPNGDIVTHAGWPNVTWINTDHHGGGSKPPKDWTPPDRLPNEESLYMEFVYAPFLTMVFVLLWIRLIVLVRFRPQYTFSKDGSIHGVMISRRAALAHCRALTVACHYSEEDVVVCVVDCRREIGLWHAVLTSIFNGLHVIFVPYSVMQVDPGSWLRMVTKYRASVAVVKSRDMHWALLAERDHPNVNLSSLRMLLVADGSNPWSLNSCDSFVQKFRSRGFRAEAICPAAGSPETLTLCLRRPAQVHVMGTTTNGKVFSNGLPHTLTQSNAASAAASSAVRGVISIHSLTYGVIRVDSEDSLTSLTLQDCGQVLPGASAVVVRLGPKPVLCRTDELGEICLTSDYTGTGYWGLRGQTGAHFHVEPLNEDGTPVNPPGTVTYTRSGYLGFPGPASSGSLIFVCGSVDGLLTVAGRRHNADDVIATVLAVQPTKIIYRGRIAVFSIELLKDERVVIIAELRQGYSDEAAFTWMSLVLQAVDSIHQVSVYCLALVQQNTLPRTPFGGINCHAVKRLFSDGHLHPTALLLCPHSAIQNLPQPRQLRPNLVGPSAIMCGQVVQGVRMAEASGRPIPVLPTPSASGSQTTPDGRFIKTCSKCNLRPEKGSTIFSIELLKDERVVIIAELRQGYSDEAAFTWMSLVLQAVDSIHQVSIYCLALVQQNTLPRTPFGGINCHAVKRLFSDGHLHPTALLLCPHSAIQNLPQPRQLRPNLVGPSAIMCGQVVQGVRMAEASGRPIPVLPTPSASGSQTTPDGRLLVEILIWRAIHTPDDRLFTVYNQKGQEASSLTCAQLLRRAERLGCLLQDKAKATVGTIVALLYPPGPVFSDQVIHCFCKDSSSHSSLYSPNLARLLVEILIWRAIHTPDDRLFTVYNQKGQEASSLTCAQLLRRAERLGCLLQDKAKATVGTIVALLYPPGTEMLCAFYACQLIGAVPVPIRPPRLDQSGFNNSSSTPSTPGSVAHLSGPVGSGSSTGLSLLGLGSSAGNQSSSGSTESWANINFRPAAPSFEASLELVWNIVKHSNASVVFTQQPIVKLLKSKEATSRIPFNHWPPVLDSEESFRKKISPLHQTPCVEQSVAYLDFAASTTGTVTGIRVTHQVVQAMCRAQKVQCEFYPTREVVLSLDPYSGLGFTLWALTSVHCGHHSILVPPSVTEAVPDLWLTVCSQRKVRDAFCSHYTMELATRHMTKQLSLVKPRDLSLSSLRSLVVVAEERPRIHLTATFTKLFSSFGLMSRAVSTSFGCRVNVAISLQGASSPESTTVYVDRISLRNDRVKMLEKGSPHSLCLIESGKLLPGVRVAIANPDTLGQCADSQLGEIWVSSPHNSTELLGPFDNASLSRAPGTTSQPVPGLNAADSLCARLVTGDTERMYARTGFLGFVRRTELTQSDGELLGPFDNASLSRAPGTTSQPVPGLNAADSLCARLVTGDTERIDTNTCISNFLAELHDAIFVVGSLEEAIMLRGMRFHPVDIENTVMRAHKKICECAVFTWSNLLVVVAELVGEENEAMDLVHPITAHVLTEHQLIVGVVVVTDPGTVPVNPCGEKQRILLRDSFVNDKLDPIYVSYNM
ncbi:hypothetical protein T265_04123 [Opisthorchis viverrini]|uniref:DMAP1-binding domain-containing protein n=1 Tax=Opisthorchis viverrini TaxID=6198 RepID=A0A074ZQ41_OPIVI|nr:hypothetical protein T265_04123 [Opisthorchis viverrini]KER29186.1 hypothetical protein T265_04123 [Opisthorchis viverrini]